MNLRLSISSLLLAGSLFAGTLFLSSYAVDENGNLMFDPEIATVSNSSFKKTVEPTSKHYSKGHYVYVNESILNTVTSSNSRIEIDISEQRVKLHKTDGNKDRLALETQVSTGKSAHPTPTGKYRILEKSPAKQSNLYGKWVDASSGSVLVSDGDSREPPSNRNAKFKGAKMPYWLRVTGGGAGLHIGYVPNGPASHGCIRVPSKIQPTLYKKVRVGTPVTIVQ